MVQRNHTVRNVFAKTAVSGKLEIRNPEKLLLTERHPSAATHQSPHGKQASVEDVSFVASQMLWHGAASLRGRKARSHLLCASLHLTNRKTNSLPIFPIGPVQLLTRSTFIKWLPMVCLCNSIIISWVTYQFSLSLSLCYVWHVCVWYMHMYVCGGVTRLEEDISCPALSL